MEELQPTLIPGEGVLKILLDTAHLGAVDVAAVGQGLHGQWLAAGEQLHRLNSLQTIHICPRPFQTTAPPDEVLWVLLNVEPVVVDGLVAHVAWHTVAMYAPEVRKRQAERMEWGGVGSVAHVAGWRAAVAGISLEVADRSPPIGR